MTSPLPLAFSALSLRQWRFHPMRGFADIPSDLRCHVDSVASLQADRGDLELSFCGQQPALPSLGGARWLDVACLANGKAETHVGNTLGGVCVCVCES